MRKISKVFIHCSDSDYPQHDDVSAIRKWHVNEKGWDDVGYHYFITKAGHVQIGRPIEIIPAAQKPHNTGSIAICLAGKDHFTQRQHDALFELCRKINKDYVVTFHGHREVNKGKTCPNFEYKSILRLNLKGEMQPLLVHEQSLIEKFVASLRKWLKV